MIDIKVDTSSALRFAAEAKGQFDFAASLALNRTGEDANATLRREIPKEFTIRDRNLLNFVAPRSLPRDQRATKRDLSVILETEAKGRILDPFEFGTPHRQKSADEPVAIPTRDLRFTEQTVVPRRWYPGNLGLTPRRDAGGQTYYALGRNAIRDRKTPLKIGPRGGVRIQGKNRTFVLDPRYHRGISPQQHGVYVRIGPDKGDIRMIWRFTDEVPRPSRLRFHESAERTVQERWGPNMEGAIEFALRTAR